MSVPAPSSNLLLLTKVKKHLLLYKSYLIDKYESQLSDIINSESEETLKAVVDVFIEDEIRIWTGLSESEMMSILEHDSAYEYLSFLSNIAFEQAKECYENTQVL